MISRLGIVIKNEWRQVKCKQKSTQDNSGMMITRESYSRDCVGQELLDLCPSGLRLQLIFLLVKYRNADMKVALIGGNSM